MDRKIFINTSEIINIFLDVNNNRILITMVDKRIYYTNRSFTIDEIGIYGNFVLLS